ncbi:MAG: hypothetical protein P8020_08865 [Acidobacteriota bacterium]|jgi:hypothetical protein
MLASEVHRGCLVRARRPSPLFRRGALFRVVSLLDERSESGFIGCQAVGRAPFRIWYFRLPDLELARRDPALA